MINKKIILLHLFVACFSITGQSIPTAIATESVSPKELEFAPDFSCYNCDINWGALADQQNNPILNACIAGASLGDLQKLNITDLPARLEKLQNGNLITKVGDSYKLAFPAVVGDKRDKLQKMIEQTASEVLPLAEKTAKDILPYLSGNEKMQFHILWSVIMDKTAWQTVHSEFVNKFNEINASLNDVDWLLYPSHPYNCGTNSYNDFQVGNVIITWSKATASTSSAPWVFSETIKKYDSQLKQSLTTGQPITEQQAKQDLAKYGLADDKGQLTIYVIDANSQAAPIFYQLGLEFGRQAVTHLDIQKIADILNVTPRQAVVIAYHELCYEILKQLAEKKAIQVPDILLKSQAEISQTRYLISIVKPVPESVKQK